MARSLFRYFNWFVYDSKILNWNQIDKFILILFFFVFTKLIWISWKCFTLYHHQFHKFVNLETIYFHLQIELIQLLATLLIISVLFYNRHADQFQDLISYICVIFISTATVFDWYSSGLLATGSVVNTMSFVYLFIILFNREIIVFTIIYTVGVTLFFLNSGIVNSDMKYAPLFNLLQIGYPNFKNSFWLWSTLYFSIPPFAVGLFILSTILKQWTARELYVTELSQKDGLTSVYNRRILNEFLVDLNDKKISNFTYAILILDLDHFKRINDTYGHLVGDQILINAADVFKQNIRRTDILGRYGGEEFIIIIRETPPYEINRLAERCRVALSQLNHHISETETIKVTCSIGVAFSQEGFSSEQVLNAADQALYQAKTRGRNQVSIA